MKCQVSLHFVPQQKEEFRFSKGKCALEKHMHYSIIIVPEIYFYVFHKHDQKDSMKIPSKGKMCHKYCRTIKN